jgi:hypothetical protein
MIPIPEPIYGPWFHPSPPQIDPLSGGRLCFREVLNYKEIAEAERQNAAEGDLRNRVAAAFEVPPDILSHRTL